MKLHRSTKLRAGIPTASMADIAFLLIIFFMLTTSFSPVKTSVDLPESSIRTEVQKTAAIVAITVDEKFVFSDGESPSIDLVSAQELAPLVTDLVRIIPNKEFVIKADRQVKYEAIDQVLEVLRNNGAKNIGLLTEQRPAKEDRT